MTWKHQILAVVTLMGVSTCAWAGDGRADEGSLISPHWLDAPVFTDGLPRVDGESMFLARAQSPYYGDYVGDTAVRFGYWGTTLSGSPNKVYEFSGDAPSSPFFDVDRLTSDGEKTVDFHITGTESESTDVGLYFFRPGLSVDIDYERFLHRLDHDPLSNFNDPTPPFPNQDPGKFNSVDVDPNGQYAIRVQEFDAKFKGRLTDNIKWRLNLWGMRKQGERQAHAMSQCYNIGGGEERCHIQSQGQRIDWLTMEIEPVIEARFGRVTVEYSRPMRSFTQSDQIVTRDYNNNSHGGWLRPGSYPYAVVPDSFYQLDRLKVGVDLDETQLYGNVFIGDTHNQQRNIHRKSDGFDLRLTNWSIDGVKLTAYAKWLEQRTKQTTVLLPEEADLQGGGQTVLPALINRTRTKAGVKARWRPFQRQYFSSGLSLTGGYEYSLLARQNLAGQPATTGNMFHVGTQMRWSSSLDTTLRYKMLSIDNPLYGHGPGEEINTSLPEHEDLIEIGGTWTPAENFLLSATFGIQKSNNHSAEANFIEDDYPLVVTAWYAPAQRWSLSAGYALYTNTINQDIVLGQDDFFDRQEWQYRGRAELLNLGARYAWSETLSFVGSAEVGRSRNGFNPLTSPAPYMGVNQYGPAALITPDFSGIETLSDVLVETTRFTAGVDYWLTDAISCYFRYNYFNYNDLAGNGNSGTGHMFLAGATATY